MSNASDFIIENGVLTKYVGPGGDVVIPEGVTNIGRGVFQGNSSLTGIVIPEGIKSIGNGAFRYCRNLKNVVIPQSVTSIKDFAFDGCRSLESIAIPDKVKSIGFAAFAECRSLTNVVIPERVTSIGDRAFSRCDRLISLMIPDSVVEIDKGFADESPDVKIHITDITVLPAPYRANAALCYAEDGGDPSDPRSESHKKYIKANAAKLVGFAMEHTALLSFMCREKLITAKNAELYMEAANKSGVAENIALMVDYMGAKVSAKQKENAEKRKEQEQDKILARMSARQEKTGIDGMVFVQTGTVETFANRNELKAFIEENGGKLVTAISANVDYLISNNAGSESEKSKKAEKLGIEVITERQFNDKAGRHFRIEDHMLAEYCGDGGDIRVPADITSIGSRAFFGCRQLVSISIPDSVVNIGDAAFQGCTGLKNIIIPGSVMSIGNRAFFGCRQLEGVSIPDGVASIGSEAFSNCDSLKNVKIPDSVTSLGSNAFSNCGDITFMISREAANRVENFQIENGSLRKYSGVGGDVVIPEGVTSVGANAFEGCSSLTSVVIPAGVTSIEGRAFWGCSALKSVIIPVGVTVIGELAFYDCKSLKHIAVPESVTRIGDSAFSGCVGLADDNGLVIVKSILFDYDGNGGDVVIPTGVTSIGNSAFRGCSALASVKIPNGVTSIGRSAFSWCSGLTEVVIPESVTSIGFEAFCNCRSLTRVVVLPAAAGIEEGAFRRCLSLTIHAPAGSYAEQYAKENNIPFVAE